MPPLLNENSAYWAGPEEGTVTIAVYLFLACLCSQRRTDTASELAAFYGKCAHLYDIWLCCALPNAGAPQHEPGKLRHVHPSSQPHPCQCSRFVTQNSTNTHTHTHTHTQDMASLSAAGIEQRAWPAHPHMCHSLFVCEADTVRCIAVCTHAEPRYALVSRACMRAQGLQHTVLNYACVVIVLCLLRHADAI